MERVAAYAVERAARGGGVRRLRVVDVADAVDLGHELEPVRDAGKRRRAPPRSLVGDARAPAQPPSPQPRSRGCARPGCSGSAGSGSSACELDAASEPRHGRRTRAARRRRRPRSGSRRSAASRRGSASNVPWRSRWSGSRLSEHGDRGSGAVDVLELEARELADDELSLPRLRHPARSAPARRSRPSGAPRIAPSSSVVVVLPFVPVTPTIGAEQPRSRARSRSRRGSRAPARRDDELRLAGHARALHEHVDAVEQPECRRRSRASGRPRTTSTPRLRAGRRRPPGARQPEHERAVHGRK